MHAVGLHSALAIRRERKRRQAQQRARERRYSQQSSDSGLTSPHCSTGSLERRRHRPRHSEQEVVSSVGMLHVGVVFLVLGVFLVASGWLPDDVTSWSAVGSAGWWNELVCVGLFSLALGIFLIVLNKYLAKSEEAALEEYVQRQLTRSRSGHRLERDAETGGMLTKHHRLARAAAGAGGAQPASPGIPPLSPAYDYTAPAEYAEHRAHGFLNALANGDALREPSLEQIVEEDSSAVSECADPARRLHSFNRDCSGAPSPPTPSDTRELLPDSRRMVMSQM